MLKAKAPLEIMKENIIWTALICGGVVVYFLATGRKSKAQSVFDRTANDPLSYF